MAVYVDDARHPFGRMIMCHMWADSLAELLDMATKIGVAHKWIQKPPKARWIHFDISLGKKQLALRSGAILTDKYGPVEHVARLQCCDQNPEIREKAQKQLERIVDLRARANPETLFA